MCFESNDAEAEFCKECGAPLKDGAEGSDQEVYTDLAKANLLRTRGDMKGANDVCLGILRRFPNNPTAHSLLGDIAADQDELKQAQTWYEMALDLVPDSANDRKKLAAVQERIKLKESAEAASILGIPQSQPKVWPYIVLITATVLAVGTGAYVLGRYGPAKVDRAATTIQTPVNFNPEKEVPNKVEPPVTEDSSKPAEEKQATTPTGNSSDLALIQALQGKSTEKLEYVSVTEDPRGPSAVVTVKLGPEQPHLTATRAGLEFFRVLPAFTKVTVRILSEPDIVFVADMSREAAKTAEAALAGGDSIESQSQVMLSQVWTPPHKAESTEAPAH